MFGYIRIDKPELRVREYEMYQSVYCGLCRSMGKCTGCLSRMTLSYDFAFLLTLRIVLTGTKPEATLCRCPAHPGRKKPMLSPNAESEYVACAAALLSYYKCKDDLADERGRKRFRARMLFGTVKRMRKKALKQHPALSELDQRVSDAMKGIAEEEHKRLPSADHYAARSGELLGEIFAFGLPDAEARIARSIGYHVGKWIYLVDAYDDLPEDRKRGRFNPYLLLFGETESEEETASRREMLRSAFLCELSEAENAMDLIDFYGYPDFEEIVKNILYRGMPRTAEAVLDGTFQEKKNEKDRRKGNK